MEDRKNREIWENKDKMRKQKIGINENRENRKDR